MARTYPEGGCMTEFSLLVTCPQGLEELLAEELRGLNLAVERSSPRGVFLVTDREGFHRLRLWSRLANRIFLCLTMSASPTREGVYEAASRFDWASILPEGEPVWIRGQGTYGDLRHSGFSAQVVKDALFDACRRLGRVVPTLSEAASHRIVVSVGKQTWLLLELTSESLHARGYRAEGGSAPLKENLAAALLMRAGWPQRHGCLLDVFCGSGTLLIEAAWMAMDHAPGLLGSFARPVHPLMQDATVIQRLREEAEQRSAEGRSHFTGTLQGSDRDPEAIALARRNVAAAGLTDHVSLVVAEALQVLPPESCTQGLILVNPPYGERLGEVTNLMTLHAALGAHWKAHFPGWTAGVFSASPDLLQALGLAPDKRYKFRNGPLEAQLCLFHLRAGPRPSESGAEGDAGSEHEPARRRRTLEDLSPGARMLANRVQKNLKQLRPWVEREGLEAWRVYDADMPEYAVAVDLYGDRAMVQEYAAPASVDEQRARQRFEEVVEALPVALGIPRSRISLKRRLRQKGTSQYERLGQARHEFAVREYGARLLVNLEDYLDSGLFLDHRPTRQRLFELATGKRFLNLFCYTGAATVHAALGGAKGTTSVDLSQTYLEWAQRNLRLNGVSGDASAHRLIRANVMEWLAAEKMRYDLIFVDPPTFSNSKRMQGVFDVQRDHVALLDLAMARLSRGGLLIFSTNFRRFRLDPALLERYAVRDITEQSIPKDFARNRRIHQCWELRHPDSATSAIWTGSASTRSADRD